ncbi:alanyl-tRNA editing protein Aarsd1 isoform X2 [Pan troglodytes]|uniref:alanyl-tRNA editing protein Aarsd1 isoform X2 n=1 Tax=Pan troglodytes TaxID=9598 RepID=UPI0030141371
MRWDSAARILTYIPGAPRGSLNHVPCPGRVFLFLFVWFFPPGLVLCKALEQSLNNPANMQFAFSVNLSKPHSIPYPPASAQTSALDDVCPTSLSVRSQASLRVRLLTRLQFTTTVVSCCPAELQTEGSNGKKEVLSGFQVVLEDTVLFPEGGGQPDDRGTINDISVLRVTRRGEQADHFTQTPLDPGSQVLVRVDWERRFDHMQQHSGQHLITAVADHLFKLKTTSWELGRFRSAIELDTPSMTAEQVAAIEQSVNEKIRDRLPVNVRELSLDDPEVEQVSGRGLPDDHAGPIRVVSIEGVDSNMCCGTHVSNLSDLQVIKILGTEKGKKNRTNLIFLAGNRVLKWMERSHGTEKALTALLKCGAEDHVEAVKKLQNSTKILQKETLLFLTVGDEKGAGLFLLAGPPASVETLGPRVAEVLEGKGAGKKGRFQGKATKMSRRMEAQALLQDYISTQSAKE